MVKAKKITTEQEWKSKVKTPESELKDELIEKNEKDEWVNIWTMKGEAYDETMSEDEQKKKIDLVMKELKTSEDALSTILAEYPDVKKAYLDNEKNPDPFYVDYNLLFNNVDMLMSLSYANEMKAIFTGTNSADNANADIITKTAEYEYREEMEMDLTEYELLLDKFIGWVGAVIREYNEYTNTPIPKCWPLQYFRPDPLWWGHESKYRYMWWYGKMTKQQMRNAGGYFNIEKLTTTSRDKTDNSDNNNNWSNVSITPDDSNDDSAYFDIYNHFRTNEEWKKELCTLSDGGKTLVRCIELDYELWGKPVFPISLDFRKPKPWYPMGIKLYDLWSRKQKVLSLLLNLAVKKAVRSSLGNHIIVDEKAVKNKNQLRQLTEFPEIILVDTENWAKNVNNIVSELQRSQVPQDNYNTDERIKQLNYEETSIWPNQLWISPTGNQTATEIKDNATNSNVRLSLSNRVSMIFRKDFYRKWMMMHQSHYPEWGKKVVVVSREFGDRYLTFERKYLDMSWDPHIAIKSKFDLEQKNAKLFANHVILHSYVVQLSTQPYVPLSVRLSMRKAYRQLWYEEDEIDDYIEESAEEREAKSQLYMLNRNEKLEPLDPEQIDEHHEDYLHVYKQAKVNAATKAAVADRIRMQKARDMQNRKAAMMQQWQNPQQWWVNQQTASVLNSQTKQQPTLADVQM